MSVALYFDVHVPSAILRTLRQRGIDILSALEDGAARLPDGVLLDRAEDLGRVVFTRDDDFLVEAAERQRAGRSFAGVIYAHQLRVGISRCIEDLEMIARCNDPSDFVGRVEHLPLR